MKWFKKNKKLSKNQLATIITLISLGLVLAGAIAIAKLAPKTIKNLPRATDEPVTCVQIESVEYVVSVPDPEKKLGPGEPFECLAKLSQADVMRGNIGNVACGWSKHGEWPMRGNRWVDVTVLCQEGNCHYGIQMDDPIDPEAQYDLVAFDMRQECGPDTGKRIPLQVNPAKTISPDEKGPDASWCDTSDKKEIWRNGRCYVCDLINSHPLELEKDICQTTAVITSIPSPILPTAEISGPEVPISTPQIIPSGTPVSSPTIPPLCLDRDSGCNECALGCEICPWCKPLPTWTVAPTPPPASVSCDTQQDENRIKLISPSCDQGITLTEGKYNFKWSAPSSLKGYGYKVIIEHDGTTTEHLAGSLSFAVPLKDITRGVWYVTAFKSGRNYPEYDSVKWIFTVNR